MTDRVDVDRIRRDYPISTYLEAKGLKLRRRGREFDACCPFHAEDTPSFQVFDKGDGERFYCHGCGEKGDILDLVERFEGIERFHEKVSFLDGDQTGRPLPAPASSTPRRDPYDAVRVLPTTEWPSAPAVGPLDYWNTKQEKASTIQATHVWEYADEHDVLGYKVRFTVQGKKAFITIAWADNGQGRIGWTMRPIPTPSPLYGLARLLRYKDARVVVFEGEKKADIFNRLKIPKTIGIGFNGGTTGFDNVDWSPLVGRSVVLWPDIQRAGINSWLGTRTKPGLAHQLTELGVENLRFIAPISGKNDGWNVDDAVDDGWSAEDVIRHMRDQIRPFAQVVEAREQKPEPEPVVQAKTTPDNVIKLDDRRRPEPAGMTGTYLIEVPETEPGPSAWRVDAKSTDAGGLKAKAAWNHMLWLYLHPMVWRAYAYDEFAQRVVWLRKMPWQTREKWRFFDDNDAHQLAAMMSKDGLDPTPKQVGAMMLAAAERLKTVHPIRDYLKSLVWDGVPRLDTWLIDYCGAERRHMNCVFGRKWMISAVARIMNPGAKVDAMLVLEGKQNLGKSLVFQILGSAVSADHVHQNLSKVGDKDTMISLQGKWIAEMAELDGLSKASVSEMKAWLSTSRDILRRPYATNAEEIPRQFVVGGTVNPTGVGYLRDTENRRFLPVEVTKVDVDGLRAVVDQLWAEATHRHADGETWWLDKDEYVAAQAIQEIRREEDPWLVRVDEAITAGVPLRIPPILEAILPEDASKHTKQAQQRVADILKTLGYERVRAYDDGKRVREWRKKES